jgi:hypothetical protein
VADPRVHRLLVYGIADAPKKLLTAIGKAAIDGEGEQPWLVTLADISRRTGWTFSEIADEDTCEIFPALIGQGMRDALLRVDAFVNSQGRAGLAESDLAVWGDIIKVMHEED